MSTSTWIACLTPPGTAALAVLAVHGPQAWEISRRLFRSFARSTPILPEQPEAKRSWLGRLGGPEDTGDEVLLVVKQMQPLPWVEIQCHGGAEVVRWLIELFTTEGATACTWQELEEHTTADRLQTSALIALTQAPTTRTAGILLDQYHGALTRAVRTVMDAIDTGAGHDAVDLVDALLRHAELGRHLTTPWRVAITGAPNVGKSSLVNALAGFQRSIVSPIPGTTRDVVATQLSVGGWPVELLDTAGLRSDATALEEQGIVLAQQAAENANLCLWLLDASTTPVWPARSAPGLRLIVNKIDLPAAWDLGQATGAVLVSAQTGQGLVELVEALAGWLVPQPPLPGTAVPFTVSQAEMLREVRAACAAGRWSDARAVLSRLGPQSV